MKSTYPLAPVLLEAKYLASFRSSTFKNSLRKWFMVILLMILALVTFSQNALVGTGFAPGWGGACGTNTDFQYLGTSAGSSYLRTTVANGTGNQYFRLGVDWDGQRRQHTLTLNADVQVQPGVEYTLNSNCTTNGAMYINVASTAHNYVFKTFNATANPQYRMVYFKVEGAVRSISNVSVPGAVTAGKPATITATLDGELQPGQGVYLRYSLDAFATSTVIPMTGAGTAFTADIPGFVQGAEVKYYCFTSGSGLAATINHSLADFYTINASTNGGLNYGYTVQPAPPIATIANGNWSNPATWEGGIVPNDIGAKAIIRHQVLLDISPELKDLDIEAAGQLNCASLKFLMINPGGSIRNKGIFNGNEIFVSFKGAGTIYDAITFKDILLSGPVNMGGSTIAGTLTLAGTGSIEEANPPVYAANSTLRITGLGNRTRGNEWTTTLIPFNLRIDGNGLNYTVCDASALAEYRIRGNLFVGHDNVFSIDPLCNGNTPQPAGPFQAVNFLTVDGDVTVDDGATLQMLDGDLGSLQQGTRFLLLIKGSLVNEGVFKLNNNIGDDFYLQGHWDNRGQFNPGGNTGSGVNPVTAQDGRAVYFNGTSRQEIKNGAGSFHYLFIDNPAGVLVKAFTVEVSRGIGFLNGKMNLDNHVLQIGTQFNNYILGKVYGSSNASYAYGGLVFRYVSNKNQPVADNEQVAPNLGEPYLVPIGSAEEYRPFTITWSAYPTSFGMTGGRHHAGNAVITGAQPDLTDADGVHLTQHYADAFWDIDFAPASGTDAGSFSVQYTCTNCQVGLSNFDKLRAIRRLDASTAWSLPGTLIATVGSNVSPTVGRSGLTSFSQYGIGYDPVVLPVKLKSFTGARTASGNALTWVSGSEQNFSHYELQRSSDSRIFSIIARINGRGSNVEQTYTHTDQKATGLLFYRLRMVDRDGTARYSSLVTIKGNETVAGELTAVFEQSSGQIRVQHGGDGFIPGTRVRLMDVNGHILINTTLGEAKVQYLKPVNLSAGVYFVQLEGREGIKTLKVWVR